MGWGEVLSGALGGIALWVAGTVFFDGVHFVLHRMLGSRWGLLRALAWPHGVHHRWLDDQLRTCWELQRANVFCHLVPEYLTQLAFSAAWLLLLPPGPVWVCIALQTAVFAYLLSQRGLDINHRAIEILDAHPPGWLCPPTYHALHHVHPDAYFSAYTKLVDVVVGGAEKLAGRRYGLVGAATPLGRALGEALRAEGAAACGELESDAPAALAELDVLLLCDPRVCVERWTEAFVAAVGDRQLPPEVWALHAEAASPLARHYQRDPRVAYRVLFARDARGWTPVEAARAARRAISLLRRGAHFAPLEGGRAAWRARRRFRATRAHRPEGVPFARSRRAALATTA